MATNGKTIVLTKDQKSNLIKARDKYHTVKEFCRVYKISAPQLSNILDVGRASEKTMRKVNKILALAVNTPSPINQTEKIKK